MKIQVMVIFGGKSVEHEISVISAIQAIHHMNTEKYDIIPVYLTKAQEMYTGEHISSIEAYRDIPKLLRESTKVVLAKEDDRVFLIDHPSVRKFKRAKRRIDVAFPIVHGSNVEDGTLQGFLKTFDLPFVGCDVIASAVGMDKHVMKTVLRDFDIPVLDCTVCSKYAYEKDSAALIKTLTDAYKFPVIVKPATLGSSIGITKVEKPEALQDALDTAFSFAVKVLVEPAIVQLREINCSVVGDAEEAEASECEEPLNATTILSYEDKYIGNASKKSDQQGMASLARQIPAHLTPAMRSEIRTLAVKTFQALGCNGVARIDFLIDAADGKVYVNEINTIPGSLSFYLWEPLGISYEKLLDRLIDLSLKRVREENTLLSSFHTNVLSLCSDGALSGSKTKLKV